ncbi:hypothetical protein ES703_56182 [subsurface metagenome]
MLDPATGLAIFLITGAGGVITYTAFHYAETFHYAEKAGPKLTINDLRPSFPWEGLPLPRFMYTKPKLIEELRRGE